MLAEAKSSLTILGKSLRLKHLTDEIFEGEMLIRTLPTALLQIFCEVILDSKVIAISIIYPDDKIQILVQVVCGWVPGGVINQEGVSPQAMVYIPKRAHRGWLINSSNAETTLSKPKDAKIFENHLNPVMLVFIGKLSRSTLRWVPIC